MLHSIIAPRLSQVKTALHVPRLLQASTARLAHSRRFLCAPAASDVAAREASAKIGRWSARLAHDNTFLSYHRNAIIATVAGCALIQYRKGEDRPPLAGAGLLAMGGLYMYIGSGLYIWQTGKLYVNLISII